MLAALPTTPAGLGAAARDALPAAGGLPTAAGTVSAPPQPYRGSNLVTVSLWSTAIQSWHLNPSRIFP